MTNIIADIIAIIIAYIDMVRNIRQNINSVASEGREKALPAWTKSANSLKFSNDSSKIVLSLK